ncbi:MAG: hypothetical protein FWH43_02335 [Endomicrobia bacterium]|nr:hypothetical protein [Endomicrobiia bacterium]
MPASLYLLTLTLTIIIETSVALILTRDKKFILLVIIAQIITNPALNFLIQTYPELYFNPVAILLLEIAVVIIEWLFYLAFYGKKPLKLFLFSLLANAGSYFFGVFIQKLGL